MSLYTDDSHARFWAYVTVSAGTPTLASSFNMTSITDTATGQLTLTIATDFAGANWVCALTTERASTALTVANERQSNVRFGGQAAGTVLVECNDDTAVTNLAADPQAWHVAGFGVQ